MMMEIQFNKINSIQIAGNYEKYQVMDVDVLRLDLLLVEITKKEGVDYVLNAIGEEAIQAFMEANGYAVIDIEKTVKAA